MKTRKKYLGSLTMILLVLTVIGSCTKNEPPYIPLSLSVTLPRLENPGNTYYRIGFDQRSIEMDFSEPVDTASITENISFGETGAPLEGAYTITAYGRKVFIRFQPSWALREGWQYFIRIGPGFRTTSGKSFPSGYTIELRTGTLHPLLSGNDTSRQSIVCISDLHMNDLRASTLGYSWFGKNMAALHSLLNLVLNSSRVKQLVILGDLFDEWDVPYRINPLDPTVGINSSRDYFLAVAASPVNSAIIGTLRNIAASGTVQLIYIPGNHDMLLTKEILEEIIPGIQWAGDATGLGHYSPVDGIIMEHGHRYDFFNAPQSLTQPGHILPPGYFITRLDAQGLMEKNGMLNKSTVAANGEFAFLTAWTAAITYLECQYALKLAPDSSNVLMGGIDGFPGPSGFNSARDAYARNIEDVWPATATANQMPVFMPATMAIVDGSSDLYAAAALQYMQSPSPVKFRIVVFGHTHNAMIKVYPAGNQYTAIYGNTGTWVDDQLTSHPVRTFIEIRPGAWNGSALDVVSLYQFNPVAVKENVPSDFLPVLLTQESLLR